MPDYINCYYNSEWKIEKRGDDIEQHFFLSFGIVDLLLVLNLLGNLVQTDLGSNTLSSCSVLGTGLVVEDPVDLFERETLKFWKDEDGIQEANDTEAHEDDVGLVANVIDHVRGDHSDSEVHLRR